MTWKTIRDTKKKSYRHPSRDNAEVLEETQKSKRDDDTSWRTKEKDTKSTGGGVAGDQVAQDGGAEFRARELRATERNSDEKRVFARDPATNNQQQRCRFINEKN